MAETPRPADVARRRIGNQRRVRELAESPPEAFTVDDLATLTDLVSRVEAHLNLNGMGRAPATGSVPAPDDRLPGLHGAYLNAATDTRAAESDHRRGDRGGSLTARRRRVL